MEAVTIHFELRFPKNLASSFVSVKCAHSQCKMKAEERLMHDLLLDGRSNGGDFLLFFHLLEFS